MPDILVGTNAHPLTEITLIVGVVGVHAHKMFEVHQRVRSHNVSFIQYKEFVC